MSEAAEVEGWSVGWAEGSTGWGEVDGWAEGSVDDAEVPSLPKVWARKDEKSASRSVLGKGNVGRRVVSCLGYWKPHHQYFLVANGERFIIDKISIPIHIRLFPKCVIKHKLLGSSSHGKDLLIRFDILHKLPNLRWTRKGLSDKSFFNPWSTIPHLYMMMSPSIESIKQKIIQDSCASSHTYFVSKHSSPLWLSSSFFVSLPFKQNEDVNPTKASHSGMNPDHYQLAIQECTQLIDQNIIEPTSYQWACEAFYVNK